MEELQRYITNIRNHYLNTYLDAIAAFKARHEQAEIEAIANVPGIEGQPEIYRWRRFDMVDQTPEPPRIANFTPDTHVNFEPQSSLWQKKMKIRFEPIAWNDAGFECIGLSMQKAQLVQWAERWMDPNSQRPVDNHGLGGRIHAITFPAKKVNRLEFFVDFGSAPVQAFQELLQVLMLAGTKKVRIRTARFKAVQQQA